MSVPVQFKFSLQVPEGYDLDKLQQEIVHLFWRAEQCRDIMPYENRDELEDSIHYQVEQSISYEVF